MKTEILSVNEALRLHDLGGYASLRADEPVAAIVQLGSDLPSWVTVVSPRNRILGMPFRVGDLHRAREGAVLRDRDLQRRIANLFPPSAICSLAPLPIVDACASDTSKSVHADLLGYYTLSAFIVENELQMGLIQGAEAWLTDFSREAICGMDDSALESAGWLSSRAESPRAYGLLLFATPAVARGVRGASIDEVIASLKRVALAGVPLESLNLDPRFYRVPKFSLGLSTWTMAPRQAQQKLVLIAELRAQLVASIDSPLFFDDVVAERLRVDDEYKGIFLGEQDAGARVRASLDRYVLRWAAALAQAVIID